MPALQTEVAQASLFNGGASRTIYARFAGRCRHCAREYRKGELISKTQAGAWVHARCADEEPAKPIAPSAASAPDHLTDAIIHLAARIETLENQCAELAKRPAQVVEIKRPCGTSATISGAHPMLAKVMAHIGLGENVLLVGPRGCGKTTLARQIAEGLGRSYADLSCSGGVTETAFTGRLCPVTGQFRATPFISTYEAGGVFLVDEIDAADPNVLMVINAALANGHITLPYRFDAPECKRHDDTVIIAAANTYGLGADRIYSGRSQLDGATLDRFTVISLDYAVDVERQLCPDEELLSILHGWRERCRTAKLRRDIGTRQIAKAYQWKHALGYSLDQIRAVLVEGWSADEIAKLGGGA